MGIEGIGESLIEELKGLESQAEGRILTEDEVLRKRTVGAELKKVILMEEISWR